MNDTKLGQLKIHLRHCNLGDYYKLCKYGHEAECPALDNSWSWFGECLQQKDRQIKKLTMMEEETPELPELLVGDFVRIKDNCYFKEWRGFKGQVIDVAGTNLIKVELFTLSKNQLDCIGVSQRCVVISESYLEKIGHCDTYKPEDDTQFKIGQLVEIKRNNVVGRVVHISSSTSMIEVCTWVGSTFCYTQEIQVI